MLSTQQFLAFENILGPRNLTACRLKAHFSIGRKGRQQGSIEEAICVSTATTCDLKGLLQAPESRLCEKND